MSCSSNAQADESSVVAFAHLCESAILLGGVRNMFADTRRPYVQTMNKLISILSYVAKRINWSHVLDFLNKCYNQYNFNTLFERALVVFRDFDESNKGESLCELWEIYHKMGRTFQFPEYEFKSSTEDEFLYCRSAILSRFFEFREYINPYFVKNLEKAFQVNFGLSKFKCK